jgi:hypothetical protein
MVSAAVGPLRSPQQLKRELTRAFLACLGVEHN